MSPQELQVQQKREVEKRQESTVPARSFVPTAGSSSGDEDLDHLLHPGRFYNRPADVVADETPSNTAIDGRHHGRVCTTRTRLPPSAEPRGSVRGPR
jgi:hypothetical protein